MREKEILIDWSPRSPRTARGPPVQHGPERGLASKRRWPSMRAFTDGRATLRLPPGLSIFRISLRLSPSYQSGFSLLKLFTRFLSALSAHRASPHPTSSLLTFFFSFWSNKYWCYHRYTRSSSSLITSFSFSGPAVSASTN